MDEELEKMLDGIEMPPLEPYADHAIEVVRAMMTVLTRRLGRDFAVDVRAEIAARAERMAASGKADDVRDAPEVQALADNEFFSRLTAESSKDGPDGA